MADEILVVTTTVASREAAAALARQILERRLAACVQLDAEVTSFYRWEGRACEDPEVRLVVKTLPGCEPALAALFAEHHPYDLPQFVAMTVRASAGYARWVRDEVAPRAGPASADGQGGA